MFNWSNEFSGIEQTLDFVDGVMETIDNDVEFFEQSVIDIMEG
jgi:6-phosphofructokinase